MSDRRTLARAVADGLSAQRWAYRIEMTGQFWSDSESFNTIRHAVMRLDPEPAAAEADFPQLGVDWPEFGETSFGGG